jgi:hypothetical protein
MVCLDRKHLLEASGWCANAGAKVQKQLLEPAPSLAPCDLPHEGHGKEEGQAQRYDSQTPGDCRRKGGAATWPLAPVRRGSVSRAVGPTWSGISSQE